MQTNKVAPMYESDKECDDCGRKLHPSDWIICSRCERDRDRRSGDFD